jgi:hypothetical protein
MPNLSKLLSNSSESLFWIGLILTDGHIEKRRRLILQLQERDAELVVALSKFLDCENRVSLVAAKPFKFSGVLNPLVKTQNSVRLQIQDSVVMEQICSKFDIKSRKTYNPPSPNILEELTDTQIMCLFVGMIAGDGSIFNNGGGISIEISSNISWIDFWQSFKTRFEKMGFRTNSIRTINKIPEKMVKFRIGDRSFARELAKVIKNENLPSFNRKFVLLQNIGQSRHEKVAEKEKKCLPLLRNGLTVADVASITGEKYADVFFINKKHANYKN